MTTAQLKARGLAKHPGGRPAIKSAELCRKIVEDIRSGVPVKKAASNAGIDVRTLRRWLSENPKFAAEFEAARVDGFKAQQQHRTLRKNLSIKAKLSKKKDLEEDKTRLPINSKKTPEVIERILETARSGMPLRFAAAAGSISVETLSTWRAEDPTFAQRLESARCEAAREKWDRIQRHGESDAPSNWLSTCWSLERSFPVEFSRPEVQLNHQHFTQTNNHNTLNISVELAESLQARSAPMRQKIEQLFKNHRSQQAPDPLSQLPYREMVAE
jgi:hypothetical protein